MGFFTINLRPWWILLCPFCAASAWAGQQPPNNVPPYHAAPFVHPGMLQSRADLEFMKQKVLAGEQPWKDAWDRLCRQSISSLDFKPKPFAHVIRGPYNNPAIGSNEISLSASAAYSHALQWYVTGDKAHAQKAIQILGAWSAVLEDFQQNDAKLLAGWTGHEFLNAAEILRSTDSGWQDKDIEQFKRMITGVYLPLLKNFFPEANGNWDAAIMDTMLCIAIFMDDHALFDRTIDRYLRGTVNGGITHYVYPSGQCQESTRDQGHTQLGLGEMAQTCRVAWTQGVDLFGAADNRLALGFEYTAKYMLGQDVPCENVISPIGRGRFSDIYYVVYDHYRFEKQIEMPFTEQAAQRTLDRSLSVLTMYKGPRPGKAQAPSAPPKPSAIAADAGAQDQPSAKPAENAIKIEPGQSVQAAIDSLHGAPGSIVLGKGVYTLPAALRISSGVTLCGNGNATILWLDSKATGPAIVNVTDDVHDITLRDLVIEGASNVRLSRDPNADRRARSRKGAPARAGIAFKSEHALASILLEHITVRNCTRAGLEIDGATGVSIHACSFTDNGNAAADERTLHNLLLSHVRDASITDSRLNNSPSGCGVEAINCEHLIFRGNEMARNATSAIHAIDSSDLRIEANLIEANEAGGIAIDAKDGSSRVIDILSNRVQTINCTQIAQ